LVIPSVPLTVPQTGQPHGSEIGSRDDSLPGHRQVVDGRRGGIRAASWWLVPRRKAANRCGHGRHIHRLGLGGLCHGNYWSCPGGIGVPSAIIQVSDRVSEHFITEAVESLPDGGGASADFLAAAETMDGNSILGRNRSARTSNIVESTL
jgi:hypothetical protein